MTISEVPREREDVWASSDEDATLLWEALAESEDESVTEDTGSQYESDFGLDYYTDESDSWATAPSSEYADDEAEEGSLECTLEAGVCQGPSPSNSIQDPTEWMYDFFRNEDYRNAGDDLYVRYCDDAIGYSRDRTSPEWLDAATTLAERGEWGSSGDELDWSLPSDDI